MRRGRRGLPFFLLVSATFVALTWLTGRPQDRKVESFGPAKQLTDQSTVPGTQASKETSANDQRVGWVCCVAFSKDGATLVAGVSEGGPNSACGVVYEAEQASLAFRDVATGNERIGRSRFRDISALAFAEDGRVLAVAAGHSVVFCDPATGAILDSSKGLGRSPSSVAFSPDGDRLVVGSSGISYGAPVGLYDYADQKLVGTIKSPREKFSCLAVSPKRRILATASADMVRLCGFAPCSARESAVENVTVTLWDLDTQKSIWSRPLDFQWRPGFHKVRCLAFSPDGRTLVIGADDSPIYLWDVANGGYILHSLTGSMSFVWPCPRTANSWPLAVVMV